MDRAEDGPRRQQRLHVGLSGGIGEQSWWVICETCGWELRGTGGTAPREQAAVAHRCGRVDDETDHRDA